VGCRQDPPWWLLPLRITPKGEMCGEIHRGPIAVMGIVVNDQ
jgi:hypothetical protein